MSFVGIKNLDELIKLAGEEDMTWQDIEASDRVNAKIRKTLNQAITPFTTSSDTDNRYFEEIPISEIIGVLEEHGYTVLQEDNTPWSGMLLGEEGNEYFHLGVKRRMEGIYEPVKNAMLALSWYKMQSGRYEITAYIS